MTTSLVQGSGEVMVLLIVLPVRAAPPVYPFAFGSEILSGLAPSDGLPIAMQT